MYGVKICGNVVVPLTRHPRGRDARGGSRHLDKIKSTVFLWPTAVLKKSLQIEP